MDKERRLERVCQSLALLASLGFAGATFWELADSFAAGHFASASAVCTAAENMWRWGVLGPVTHVLDHPPTSRDFYCHHPWGIFWTSALFMKVLGHHAWACRLPAALQSSLTVPALYFVGRALWGPVAGAVGALGFAALPIALSFADFNSLEVPVIFGAVLSILGYAHFRRTEKKRFAALALAGLTYAVCCDWAAIIFGAAMLGSIFLFILLPRRFTPAKNRPRLFAFWLVGVVLSTLAVGGHLLAFSALQQLNELRSQATLRSAGSDLPLEVVLAARKFWIEVSFTGLAIAIGKLALPVLAVRTLLRRSELEALPLAVFAMAAFQYVVFKQGADIHVFWPHYFALYFAFASGGLIQTGLDLSQRLAQRFPGFGRPWLNYGWLSLGTLASLLIVPDGVRALSYAHRSGGRFNENGHLIKPDKDKVAALEWLTAHLPLSGSVALHPGMRQSLWVDWSLERPVETVNYLPLAVGGGKDRYYVADLRFLRAADQDALGERFSLTALGPFIALDRTAPRGTLSAFSVQRRAPNWLEAYWVSSSHALRRVEADPFLAWELRDRFLLTPNPPPEAEPTTFEETRVLHNIAVARGDVALSLRTLDSLLSDCDRRPARRFSDGNALLCVRLERGASLVYTVYFQAAGPDPSEPALLMHSVVSHAPFASLVAKDPAVAEVGMPFTIPASRWKAGYVYSSVTEVIRRLGGERWFGTFRAPREMNADDAAREFELPGFE